MAQRVVMVVSAVVYAIFGAGFLLAPDVVLGIYGGMSMEPETDHVLGAALIGFALVNAFARAIGPDDARRGVLIGNLAFNGLAFGSTLLVQLEGGPNALNWSTVLVTLALAIGFAYVLVRPEPHR